MPSLENYFQNQLRSHQCQLPPSDDFEYLKRMKKLKRLFLVSEKSLRSYIKFGSISAINYEKLRQLRTTNLFIIHPYSEFRRIWHFASFILTILCFLIFPFFSAFLGPFYAKLLIVREWEFRTFYAFLCVMFVLQLFCIVEIVINFQMGYVKYSTDKVVIDQSQIAKHYLGTYFILDVLSSIPFDAFILFIFGLETYANLSQPNRIVLNILPLLKLGRLGNFMSDFHCTFEFLAYSYSTYNLVFAITLHFLIVHWGACLWMLLPRWQHGDRLMSKPNQNCNFSWAMNASLMFTQVSNQYMVSLYRSLTCFVNAGYNTYCLVGIVDILLSLFLGILGKIYKILLIVVFVQMMSTLMTGRILYLEIMDQVQEYMHLKKFPTKLRKRILANYIYLYQKEYIGEHKILRLLSDNLRREILLRMHETLIKKVHVFSELSQNFILDVVSCMKPEIYLEGDIVYKVGEVGDCMYFVAFGTVAVYSEDEVEIGHLEDGNHFGETSLISHTRRRSTVIATEDTQLFRLDGRDFQDLMKLYPEAYLKMKDSSTSDSTILRNSEGMLESRP